MRRSVILGLLGSSVLFACGSRPPLDRTAAKVEKGFYCYAYVSSGMYDMSQCFLTMAACEREREPRESKTNGCRPEPHAWCLTYTTASGRRELDCALEEQFCNGSHVANVESLGGTNLSRCEQL